LGGRRHVVGLVEVLVVVKIFRFRFLLVFLKKSGVERED